MTKTCRTCVMASEILDCDFGWPCTGSCENHVERETPLLVDELALAAKLLLEKMDNIGDGMLFNLDLLDARDALRKSLARYKEEVGDA